MKINNVKKVSLFAFKLKLKKYKSDDLKNLIDNLVQIQDNINLKVCNLKVEAEKLNSLQYKLTKKTNIVRFFLLKKIEFYDKNS